MGRLRGSCPQGVGDFYTDPQIHSYDGQGFGFGNMGRRGIDRFLATHRCNDVCRAVGLPAIQPPAAPQGLGHTAHGTGQGSRPPNVCLPGGPPPPRNGVFMGNPVGLFPQPEGTTQDGEPLIVWRLSVRVAWLVPHV